MRVALPNDPAAVGRDILVVADHASLRRDLPRKLEGEGFDVRVAHGVTDAVELARENPPHAVVLDLFEGSEDAWRRIKPAASNSRLIVAGRFTMGHVAERLRADVYVPGGDIPGIVDAVLGLQLP